MSRFTITLLLIFLSQLGISREQQTLSQYLIKPDSSIVMDLIAEVRGYFKNERWQYEVIVPVEDRDIF